MMRSGPNQLPTVVLVAVSSLVVGLAAWDAWIRAEEAAALDQDRQAYGLAENNGGESVEVASELSWAEPTASAGPVAPPQHDG